MAKDAEAFRVRLNCLDHYQSTAGPLDPPLWGPTRDTPTQRNNLPQVPVIRVFGATETGQKVCMHIHGAFPYLYIPYTESVEQNAVDAYITTIRHSIDHALALSYRRHPYDSPRNSTFVAHISLVKGVPFFGYNVGHNYFLKIYLLNPMHMTRFNDLLQQGAILRRVFQPFEAHLQYLLQWMCDFNLYGCAYIECAKPRFREPVPVWKELDELTHLWHDRSIKKEQLLEEAAFPRQSHCQLELDIRVEDIINRNEIQARPLHHSFIERLSSLENLPPEEKLVHSMAGLWKDETRRRKRRMGLTNPTSSPFPPEVLVSMSADPRNNTKGGWIHEDEFREMIDQLVSEERKARGGGDISFEAFETGKETKDDVPTVLESVVDLFHDTLVSKWASDGLGKEHEQSNVEHLTQTKPEDDSLVDLGTIAQLADEDEYESDEEAAMVKALTQRQKLADAGLGNDMGEAKVSGDAREIEAAAEHMDDATVPPEALEHAESIGAKRRALDEGQDIFKKPRISTQQENVPSKGKMFRVQDAKRPQQKSDEHKPDMASSVGKAKANANTNEPPLPPSGQPLNLSQQSSSSSSRKLSFPSVKDPNDPETQMRLSQRDKSNPTAQKDTQSFGDKKPDQSFGASFGSMNSVSSTLTATRSKTTRLLLSSAAISNYAKSFCPADGATHLVFNQVPPTFTEVDRTVTPSIVYQSAYYSSESDVPERPREYAGQEFRLDSLTLPFLPPFDKGGASVPTKSVPLDKTKQSLVDQRRARQCSLRTWEILQSPPTYGEVHRWMQSEQVVDRDTVEDMEADGPPTTQVKRKNRPAPELSQIDGPTQKNKHGFKFSRRKASTSVQHETGYMSTMSLEVHVNTRADLSPDPEKDAVSMVVWCLAEEKLDEDTKVGIVVLTDPKDETLVGRIRGIVGNTVQIDEEDDELDLFNRMVDIVRSHDPDILTGYEVHNSSWGYLIERARLQYEFNLPDEFSRMKSQSHGRFGKNADKWGFTHTSTVRITGRHTINIWRAMRSELNLLQYTMENVVFHLLHRRTPHYSFATLTRWFRSSKPRDLAKALDYFFTRTKLDLEIIDANELIPRTSEQARLLGVDFFSVFSRGSQFKVESLMFRIAKPESFVLVSPSRKQVGAQNALECLPLVMEPMSSFYTSPVLVLDFQSLYPSIVIAYNYCYSTCLGRITNWRGTNKMGFADFKRTPGLLELVKDKVNISPNGMMYVKPEMRKSLLAKMLGEILETRVMVKSGMKVDKNDKTLQQLLNNRQLALKLIANVTYGYTSASFSGRMPCSEIADSIVQTGRETLEKAIALIHSVERWGAEVVYGDTDSLFIHLKGRSKDEAFKIGDEISKAVTDMNPRPIKLKFEKVYHPCVLLAKKRYVGFKYEHPSQTEPDFDAKGIETVRRDGTPAEQKIEEKALKLLFRTSDLSEVKRYFQAQCTKIMTGRFSVQDFCFAKEVKLGTYSDKGPAPPGALIATKRMLKDPRLEPQYGERVPYVVIAGALGARLFERCVEPERLISEEHAELDAEYYISKNLIPPLERIFNLVGANVRQWYDEMPKVQRIRLIGDSDHATTKKKTMESYMGSSLCIVCRDRLPKSREPAPLPLCHTCRHSRSQQTLLELQNKIYKAERRHRDLEDVCRSCAGLSFGEEVKCDSRDCPVFYSRVKGKTMVGVVRSGVGRVLEGLEKEVAARELLEW
jgi:DNA polymerase zeta